MQHYPSREYLGLLHTHLGEILCVLYRNSKDFRKVANDPYKVYLKRVQVLRIPLLEDDIPYLGLKKSKSH